MKTLVQILITPEELKQLDWWFATKEKAGILPQKNMDVVFRVAKKVLESSRK